MHQGRRMGGAVVARAAAAVVGLSALTRPVCAIVSSNAGSTIFNGVNINKLVGAETFYFAPNSSGGYLGLRSVVANVEAGHVWNGHETTGHVSTYLNDPSIDQPQRQYDWHATMVGHTIAGQGPFYGINFGTFDTATWFGIAPTAQLWSTAIASQWDPEPGSDYTGSFEITDQSLLYGYKKTMIDGVNGRRADVVNSSWGFDDSAGNFAETMLVDALAYQGKQTVVIAAGNHDTGNPPVGGPASGYNSITVGALTGDTLATPYSQVADFSNRGRNDFYNPKTGVTTPNARVAVDLAAPGDNLTLAFYGGVTGGHTSGTDPTGGSGSYYIYDIGGTSFASPIVAGGAALVVDVGYAKFGGGTSVDGRVVKAVLMNSASKLPGWNNGQQTVAGVVRTSQALDEATGAGSLNLTSAFAQFTAGTTDVPGVLGGVVTNLGWDFGKSTAGLNNDYFITGQLQAGSTFAATLDWFVDRAYDDATNTVSDVQFADLDLEVWSVINGLPSSLVAVSESDYSNVEHLYFSLPSTGLYMLRVRWDGEAYDVPGNTLDVEDYGLAWSGTLVPEPATGAMLLACVSAATFRRARARKR